MALAIFLHEIDLSLENIGLDAENRVVKIDGDWSLAEAQHPELFRELDTDIDARLLLDVFFLDVYQVYNWFDIIESQKNRQEESEIFLKNMNESSSFQKEFYHMIMMIALFPDEYYQKMIRMCLPVSEYTNTFEFIQTRKEALIDAAFQMDSFVDYVLKASQTVDMVINEFFDYVAHFQIQKNELLLPDTEHSTVLALLNSNRRRLLQMATRILSSPKGIDHSFSSSSMFGSQYQFRIKGLPLSENSQTLTKLSETLGADDNNPKIDETDESLIADQSLTF